MKIIAALAILFGAIHLATLPAMAEISPNRLLILFSQNTDDARLTKQTDIIAHAQAGMTERDLLVLKAIGSDEKSAALRHRYNVTASFRILLVGKDGHTAMSSDQPIASPQLFSTIDAMPMRQEEMRCRK